MTVETIINKLTPAEKRELDLAKRLLIALTRGPVQNFGSVICNQQGGKLEPLRMTPAELHEAVRCLQRLNYGVDRFDAGGSPTWVLTSMPA